MGTIVVGLVVALMLFFAARHYIKGLKSGGCGCGCSGCAMKDNCHKEDKKTE